MLKKTNFHPITSQWHGVVVSAVYDELPRVDREPQPPLPEQRMYEVTRGVLEGFGWRI